jgi:hypothetical protein
LRAKNNDNKFLCPKLEEKVPVPETGGTSVV